MWSYHTPAILKSYLCHSANAINTNDATYLFQTITSRTKM